jgi:DNA polymerase elongation subunit (family B)
MSHNFKFVAGDTDGLKFCKQDNSTFTEEEFSSLVNEMNSQLPELVKLEKDGIYRSIVIIKTKNYIFDDFKKVKFKGGSLTDSKKESALIEMIQEIGIELLENNVSAIQDIYHKYIIESQNVTDINRWTTKRTITKSVMNPERTNEQKVLDCLEGEEFREGDKIYVYFDVNDELKLADKWNGDEHKERLLKRVYNTIVIFENLLDMNKFTKYHLKGKKEQLNRLLMETI